MSMPPSGSDKCGMDEEAIIEAEIQFELDNINLDDDLFVDNGDDDVVEIVDIGSGHDFNIPDEVDDYVRRIQDQTNRFEQELQECDEILLHSDKHQGLSNGLSLIPYEDQQLLNKLAGELGYTVDEYKKKILEDIEHDNFEIKDELAEFIDDDDAYKANTETKVDGLLAITDGQTGVQGEQENIKLESDIEKAVEKGIVPSEVPVTQELLPPGKKLNGTTNSHLEIQQMLREQLEKLESRYEERLEKMKKEDAFYKNEEEVRQKRLDEERLWKKQELEREEQKLKLEQELSERKVEEENSQRETRLREQIKQFEKEMAVFKAETEKEKEELERNMEIERQKQIDKQNKAALMIQKTYRGHRVRQTNKPALNEKREVRMKEKEERRIREVEQEIYIRNEEKKRKEEEERLRVEEEKKKQEEIKRQKEFEKQQREEEKRRKKEEEERKKQEEKQRKEEEKQRKKEEERKKKEEEKKRKEEEERRKKEEKRLKEEQERQRKEEEKLKREEEKRRKEEEKRVMEEERKRKIEEEKREKEEEKVKRKKVNNRMDGKENELENTLIDKDLTSCNPKSDYTDEKSLVNGESVLSQSKGNLNSGQVALNVVNLKEVSSEKFQNVDTAVRNSIAENSMRIGNDKANHLSTNNHNPAYNDKPKGETVTQEVKPSLSATVTETYAIKDSALNFEKSKFVDINNKQEELEKLQKSGHIPHPPSPRKTTKSNHHSKVHGKPSDLPATSADTTNIDCLPEQLECLRLKFMKECQPWSKVSNEPWKLKAGLSKKPLRRPSSAKKLPLLPDTAILQAARVASLQQVTTVQLCDLPGNNISPLGQCWGLKYLSMCNCNLVALDGLGQCKQLQYIDVRNNKIEYIDLKDVGQLQYLNVSHNRLSSVHGVDNCSSLRWIDLSHNNITKLGSLEALRRLNTLILSHNQLINAEGLGATPTLQTIDLSHNHLQEITDLDKLCLLLTLNLSSNNLLKIPCLKNQVLLQDLNLSDNSISTIDDFSTVWLPLLNTLGLSMNSLDTLPSLHNCLTLKKLDLSNNQITEFDTISKCVEGCLYLEHLLLEDNPVIADFNTSHIHMLEKFCPRLHIQDNSKSKDPIKPRTSFEMMCLTQCTIYKDVRNHFDATLKSLSEKDLASISDSHYKYCEKLFNTAVEHRYAHEYGEVTVTMPTAPTTPKSGRPKSGRQKDSYASPKDMFENALKASSRPNVGSSVNNPSVSVVSQDSNPKDLFEQALKSADSVHTNKQSQQTKGADINGIDKIRQTEEQKRLNAIVTIQAYWRGWLVRHEIAEHTRIWLAATAIQACWRGYIVRKQLRNASSFYNIYKNLPTAVLQHMNKSATKIQAMWRGYNLRRKLLAALEYAQCNFDEEEDEDAMMFGDDFDLDKFVSLDQNLLDEDWKPPDTPDIPSHHAVLKKPPSGRAKIPPIPLNDVGPPNNPRRAWRNIESPLTDVDKISRPPSSVASTDLTARTHVSKKEERLTEEWGFKDTNTAHLMVQRAKKMKYNAERRNKISKLDPKQRLALFRKLEEVTHPRTVPVPQRKTLPRKEYFKARQQEIYRQEQEKQEEYNVKASRTFEWLHTQVGDHVVSDSVINKGYVDGPSYVPQNFPELHGIRRVQLTQSPGSLDLQSVDSVSSAGHKPRRASIGTAGSTSSSKLPPIQTSSAPTQHVKERMSFRNPRVNQSVGWGGGKKRGSIL